MAQSELQNHLSRLAKEIEEVADSSDELWKSGQGTREAKAEAFWKLLFKSRNLAYALRYHAGEQDENGNAVEVE